ncbi:hypothetical protein GCM10027046_36900 [Uliginosibacterium flavum]
MRLGEDGAQGFTQRLRRFGLRTQPRRFSLQRPRSGRHVFRIFGAEAVNKAGQMGDGAGDLIAHGWLSLKAALKFKGTPGRVCQRFALQSTIQRAGISA